VAATPPEPRPATEPIDDGAQGPAGPAAGGGDPGSGAGPRAPLGRMLAAGLVVGVLSWLAGEAARQVFSARRIQVTNRRGVQALGATDRTAAAAEVKNVALSSGLFGALLGTFLGACGGLGRRSPAAARRAALIGLGAGAVAGTGMALVIVPRYFRWYLRLRPEGLVPPLLMHGGIWGAIGAAGGLAFGLGLGGRGHAAKALLGGLLGALMGTALYEILGALAFPMSRTDHPVAAAWAPRLLARLLVATLAATATAMAVTDPQPTLTPRQPATPPPGD
jgi:hypothetical protein